MEKLSAFFKIQERGSNVKTELLAGLTTFLAMAYILPVNAQMLAQTGMPYGGVFLATALSAFIATLIMGLLANYPVALAPGMGINAFFTFTVVFGYGLSYQAALAAVFISGILFLLISIGGLRKIVIDAIPAGLKIAVGAGIGFFITFIGLTNAGIIVDDPATLVALGDFSNPAVLLAIFGLIVAVVLFVSGNKFSIIIAIGSTAVVGLILGLVGVEYMPAYSSDSLGGLWEGITDIGFSFVGGFGELFSSPEAFLIIFTLLFVDFFDTAGTLIGVGKEANLLNEEGELLEGNKPLLADSIGTVVGAALGTSTVTSYVESTTGIEQGGRTGLTAVTVALLFLVSILLYPLLSVVNGVVVGFNAFDEPIIYSPVTAMALIMVGALMIRQLKDLDWNDQTVVIPTFLTIIFMVLSYSIAEGIAIGFIFYPITMIAAKRTKEINPVMWGLLVVFVLRFILELL